MQGWTTDGRLDPKGDPGLPDARNSVAEHQLCNESAASSEEESDIDFDDDNSGKPGQDILTRKTQIISSDEDEEVLDCDDGVPVVASLKRKKQIALSESESDLDDGSESD